MDELESLMEKRLRRNRKYRMKYDVNLFEENYINFVGVKVNKYGDLIE